MNGSLLILGTELYNIKIQRAGQIMPEVRIELLPAADLERYLFRRADLVIGELTGKSNDADSP
jgi:hypothetical protein